MQRSSVLWPANCQCNSIASVDDKMGGGWVVGANLHENA